VLDSFIKITIKLIHSHAYILNKIELNLSMRQHRIFICIALLFSFLFGQNSTGVEVKGTAVYKSGTILENAEVTLMDSTDRVITRAKTSKKFLKRFGGGGFSFNNIPHGSYIVNIKTGEDIDINHRFEVQDKKVDLGTLYPFKEFPIYQPSLYEVDSTFKMRRIASTPISSDTVNIKHVIVDLDGSANTVLVDSVIIDTVFFTDAKDLTQGRMVLDKVYFIYNDYGIFIHQSRSLKDRMKELQKRDGYIIFHNGDTLNFDNIFFEPVLRNPEVATFHITDSTRVAVYHSLYDIYKIRSGPSYVGQSVKKGYWLGINTIAGIVAIQVITQRSITPFLQLMPDFSSPITGNYGTAVTIIPLFTLGQIAYDWYKDKRSNYFIPTHEHKSFPKNMFVFDLPEWMWKKSQPIVRAIMNSRPVKWWSQRKLRKVQKQAIKRKSASD